MSDEIFIDGDPTPVTLEAIQETRQAVVVAVCIVIQTIALIAIAIGVLVE